MPAAVLALARALLLAAAVASTSGCVSQPNIDERGLLPSARRVLGIDFSRSAGNRRLQSLRRAPAAAAGELRRPLNWSEDVRLLSQDLRRATRISDTAGRLLHAGRKRDPLRSAYRLLPNERDLAQHAADDLDLLLRMLGPGRRPLGEIDDIEHRTDFRDDRPERTLWQRLRRRLRF
ncbi:MAG: hypothetical protein AB8H80_19995 [Planctomycetota bacterium]